MIADKMIGRALLFQRSIYIGILRKRTRFPACRKETYSSSSVLHQNQSTSSSQSVFRSQYDITIPDSSVCDHIFPCLEKHGQKTFLIDGITGQSYTFHDCLRYSQKVASGLKKLGLQKGDVVGIYSGNRPEYIIAWLAISMVGAVITEVNPTFTSGELTSQLKLTDADYLIVDSELVSAAKELPRSLQNLKKVIVFGAAEGFMPFGELMKDDGFSLTTPVDVDPNSVSHIPFSSGTTGLHKGVMVSQKGVIGGAISCSHQVIRVSEYDDVCVLLLPLFHIYGNFLTWCNAMQGCTTITLPRFTPESLLSAIQKYRATYLPLVPPLVLFLLQSPLVQQYDISTVNNILCGAAPVSASHLEMLTNNLNLKVVRQGYGMSESCPTTMSPRGDNERLDSVGQPTPGVEVKIVDVNTGLPVKVGEQGEICSRAPFQMMGYYKNPEATAATIDADGWLHTGDTGYMTEKGHLYVVDRIKELIKYKGHQVAPAELESLLLSHSAVKDCAVIGVPDERAGELPRAFVVLDSARKNVSSEELQKFVSDQTSDEKHLRGGVVFTDVIPKSTSGKILRKELRKMSVPTK